MNVKDLSVCFITTQIAECKEFYTKYFGATISFDAGWYLNLNLGKDREISLTFMSPQSGRDTVFNGNGIMLNVKVDDVDVEHQRLVIDEKLQVIAPIEDHAWGDRAFSILDPLGNALYIYSDREPSGEYINAFK